MIYGSGLLENLTGTMDSLASLVMTYLDDLVHHRHLARDLKFLVCCLVRFHLGTRDGLQGRSLSALRKQLFQTLRNKECAPACVAVVRVLLGHDRQNTSVACHVLIRHLDTQRGYRCYRQSSGLVSSL